MGLGEFASKFEYVLRMGCVANGYLNNIGDLKLIENLTSSNEFNFKLDKKDNVSESFNNIVKYTNLLIQTFPSILDMNYRFDQNDIDATLKHLDDFKVLINLKEIISNCHYHLMVVAPQILILKQKLKEFTNKNLNAKLEKNKITIRELLVEEEKFKLLSSGILKDKKFNKTSIKTFKLISKLLKKSKLYLKDTKNNDIELIKKYISQGEILNVVTSANQMEFNKIYIHAMATKVVDDNPTKYQTRLTQTNNNEKVKFNSLSQIDKIEDAMYGVLYYAISMAPTIDELFYQLEHNNYLGNFQVPYKIRKEDQVQHLIDYLKEKRASNLDEAVEIYEKEVGPAYERILLNDEFDEEKKQANEFLSSLEKSKKQEVYLDSQKVVSSNKAVIDKEVEKYVSKIDAQIKKTGKLAYVKSIGKMIPYKGLVKL